MSKLRVEISNTLIKELLETGRTFDKMKIIEGVDNGWQICGVIGITEINTIIIEFENNDGTNKDLGTKKIIIETF